jgi:hypothetical protein
VGPRANLDVFGEEKNLLPLPEIESRSQKLYSYINCSLQIVQKRNEPPVIDFCFILQ